MIYLVYVIYVILFVLNTLSGGIYLMQDIRRIIFLIVAAIAVSCTTTNAFWKRLFTTEWVRGDDGRLTKVEVPGRLVSVDEPEPEFEDQEDMGLEEDYFENDYFDDGILDESPNKHRSNAWIYALCTCSSKYLREGHSRCQR